MLTRTKHRGERRTTWAAGRDIALLERRTVVSDSFNRADNSTSLGTADTGQVWSNLSNSLGIFTNTAGSSVAANDVAVVDAKQPDGVARVTLSTVSGQMWLNVRVSDANNRIRYGADGSGNLLLQKVVAASGTTLASVVRTLSNGDVLTLAYHGSDYVGYVNGVALVAASDPFNATATQVGLQTQNTTCRFDNFMVLK